MCQYDLFSREFKTDPFPTYAEMRRDCPIYAHQSPHGATIWYITRHVDVVAVLKDNENFTKQPLQQSNSPINRNMLFSDPPDHTRLRALVNLAFTPKRVAGLRGRVVDSAENLLAPLPHKGQTDLISTYALPFSVMVISDMLGIPPQDQTEVAAWSQSIISPGGRGLKARERKRMMRQFVAYLRDIFADRERHPQDDLITALVQAEESGDKLNESELSSMIALLLVTGHETTVNLIGNGVLALLLHPEQRALVQNNPALMSEAIEELLRYDGPVETSTTRWVAHDCVFKGHAMQRGDVVRVVITSANRDSAEYDNPDTLDLTRSHKRHLQFGMGIHYCLGAPLARLEGEIALNTLFQRFPDLHLACTPDQLKWRSGVLFRGLETLPVAWGE